jgi:chromosome segregation ATPase
MAAMQKQTEDDQKTIAHLKELVDQANAQVARMNAAITDLQKQIALYREQNSEFSRSNTQLQQQIKTLTAMARSPDIDVSSINAHASAIEKAIEGQKAQAEKSAKTNAELLGMLDALDQRLKKK